MDESVDDIIHPLVTCDLTMPAVSVGGNQGYPAEISSLEKKVVGLWLSLKDQMTQALGRKHTQALISTSLCRSYLK